jgi:hypothetical protein
MRYLNTIPTAAALAALVATGASLAAGAPDDARPGAAIPVAATVLGEQVRTRDAEELRYLVLRPLADRYAREKGIDATAADKAAYAKHMETLRKRDREETLARRDQARQRLASGSLADAERAKAAADLAQVEQYLATLDDLEAAAARDPAETRAARDRIAGAFILQWKLNADLHRRYGGRIIYQQGGPEPLDAWRLFLEERQRRAELAFLDAGLERAFWRYYTDDAIHSFYERGSREEREAFATPPWLRGAGDPR